MNDLRIVACPHCGKKTKVRDDGRYRCPWCQALFHASTTNDTVLIEPPAPQEPQAPADQPDRKVWPSIEVVDSDRPPAGIDVGQPVLGEPVDAAPDQPADMPVGLQVCESCRARPAGRICPSCGAMLCGPCSGPDPDKVVCPVCGLGREKTGFAAWKEKGVGAAFFDTLRGVLFSPRKFFTSLDRGEKDLVPALIFAMIVETLAGMANMFYNSMLTKFLKTMDFSWMSSYMGQFQSILDQQSSAYTGYAALLGALWLPVYSIMSNIVMGLILHVCYMLTGNASGGLIASIKVVAYASATSIFLLLPLFGTGVSIVWYVVAAVIGGQIMHNTTMGKSVTAVLLPMLLLCGCGMIVAIGVGALAGLAK